MEHNLVVKWEPKNTRTRWWSISTYYLIPHRTSYLAPAFIATKRRSDVADVRTGHAVRSRLASRISWRRSRWRGHLAARRVLKDRGRGSRTKYTNRQTARGGDAIGPYMAGRGGYIYIVDSEECSSMTIDYSVYSCGEKCICVSQRSAEKVLIQDPIRS